MSYSQLCQQDVALRITAATIDTFNAVPRLQCISVAQENMAAGKAE